MDAYDVNIDGYRPTAGEKAGYMALGFAFGWAGIMADWAIARQKKMMECSAEGIYLGIIGWAISIICWYALTVAGVLVPSASLAGLAVFGGAICIGAGLVGVDIAIAGTIVGPAAIDGWANFVLVGAILFVVLGCMWVYGMRYKLTPTEKARTFHGDDWIKPGEKHLRYDSAITIDAAPEKIWPYIRQAGQSKAGWYSFDWLERLCTFKIYNHYDIHPEWQDLEVGSFQFFHQPPLTIGEWVTEVSNDGPWYFAAHSDTATDPGYKNPGPNQEKALKLWFKRFCWTWNWELVPVPGCPADAPRTRLMWRCDCTFERYHRLNKYFVVFILGTASIVMGRNFMDVMKALCEGRLRYPDSKR